jgi:hypothetical protein
LAASRLYPSSRSTEKLPDPSLAISGLPYPSHGDSA